MGLGTEFGGPRFRLAVKLVEAQIPPNRGRT